MTLLETLLEKGRFRTENCQELIQIYRGNELNSLFGMTDNYQNYQQDFEEAKGLITILWNRQSTTSQIIVDGIPIDIQPDQIVTLTYLQKVEIPTESSPLTAFTFNREFYCINDHDHEVSCNGIIFFGTQDLPIISLDGETKQKLELLYKIFVEEFKTRDGIQGEMLEMLLKRLIIICTRIAKQQLVTEKLENNQIDIVRRFNVLVDTNYRAKKHVSDYAEMLNKSPKTLSNLFATYNQKSPLQVIHERIVLEAKRLMLYTDKTLKEIAYDLGFDDVAHFNKMFKKVTALTPSAFRNEAKTSV